MSFFGKDSYKFWVKPSFPVPGFWIMETIDPAAHGVNVAMYNQRICWVPWFQDHEAILHSLRLMKRAEANREESK